MTYVMDNIMGSLEGKQRDGAPQESCVDLPAGVSGARWRVFIIIFTM